MGAPGEEPTTAEMRSSNAAARTDCLPFRECPVMKISPVVLVLVLGMGLVLWLWLVPAPPTGSPIEGSASMTREASQARRAIFPQTAGERSYAAANSALASLSSAPGYTTAHRPRPTARCAQSR